MRLPTLSELATSRDMIDVFGGYNHNLRIGENEFYDMTNLSSAHYPLLAPRRQRGTFLKTEHKPVGLIEKDSLCYAYQKGSNLFFSMNGDSYDLGMINGFEINENTERTLVSMGAYVIILPDKMYINTKDTTDFGYIEASYSSAIKDSDGNESVETARFQVCRMDGEVYEVDTTGPEEPGDIQTSADGKSETKVIDNGHVWLDTSVTPNSLKIYSEATGMWSSVATTYLRITVRGIGAAFKEFDGVRISGITVSTENDLNTPMVIYSIPDEDSIVVVGLLKGGYDATQDTAITVERVMPNMDFVIESNNRLWGCRYGLNRSGEVVNELYCSKLGDFKNWECFAGISTDSYYVSLGTDGQFTGAISYLGQPLFFKENCLHMVYGSFPAEFQVQDTACRGVQKGSGKSLAMVNEVLYYKSRTGICSYSGSLPVEISSVLGEKAYSNAVACGYKGKYYVSMKDVSNEKYVLFVCDTEKGMWHKEDELHVKAFCPVDEEIYLIDNATNAIRTLFGSGEKDTAPIKWMAESGIIGCGSPDKKYVSRLSVRLSMDIGAKVIFYIQYDSSEHWEYVCIVKGNSLRTMTLPIRPKRCDHFKLKIEGEGNAKIFSITKVTEQGSDI